MRNINKVKLVELVSSATHYKKSLISFENLNYFKLREYYEMLGYPFFTERKEYNLNIGAIRSADLTVDVYNDLYYIAWQWKGKGYLYKYRCTTDTGLYYLNNPLHPKGTAIIVPDFYKGVYSTGYHQRSTTFSHYALRQKAPMKYWRIKDYKQGSQLPINQDKVHESIANTNIHSKPIGWEETKYIGRTSAGCVVVANPKEFKESMNIVDMSKKNFSDRFSFALIYEPELIV